MVEEMLAHLLREKGIESFGRFYAPVQGIVADRKDPEKRGRIQVKIPVLFGNQEYNIWAIPKGMFAGTDTGFFVVPEIGDTVWITFQAGDIRFPIWEHGYWENSAEAVQDLYDEDGEPTKVVLKTHGGQSITLDDKNSLISIKDKDGNEIQINHNGISVVTDKKISLGKLDGSAEPGVLGDKLVDLENDELDAIMQITVMTAMGTSSIPINLTDFQQIKATKVTPIKSQKTTLD
jgi:hypothetical protein